MNILKKDKFLLISIILFIFTRAVIILFFIDTVYTFDSYIGFISKELLNPKIPLFDYSLTHREIFQIVFAILYLPFAFVFGNNYISIKLFALCLSTINLIIWYYLLKNISQKAARIFLLLYIFSPTIFTNITLVAWPAQFYVSLFIGASILLFINIINSSKENNFFITLLGFTSGLGSWFYYVYLLILPFLFFIWFIKDKLFFWKKSFIFFIFSFCLGIFPWFFYNINQRFFSLNIGEYKVYQLDFKNVISNMERIFALFFPNIFLYRGLPVEIGYLYYLLFLVCFVIILLNWIRRLHLVGLTSTSNIIKFLIVNFTIFYLALLCSTRIPLEARYVFCLFPFIFSIVSLVLIHLSLIFKKIILIIIIIFHLFTYIERLPYTKFMQGRLYKGERNYNDFGELLSEKGYSGYKISLLLKSFSQEIQKRILLGYQKYALYRDFDETTFLIKKCKDIRKILCEAFARSSICEDCEDGGFKKYFEKAINICGKVYLSDWKDIKLQSQNAHEIIEKINSLPCDECKKIAYNYLGGLTFQFKKDLYSFYKDIPPSYKYLFAEGFAYEEINSLDENMFFLPQQKNGFETIANLIQRRISSLTKSDKSYVNDIYAAYISVSYLFYCLELEDDYMVQPLNIYFIKNFLSKIKDRKAILYICLCIKKNAEIFKRHFDENKIESALYFLSKLN
jgi:hypothetical protein